MIETPTYYPQRALPQTGLSLVPPRHNYSAIFKAVRVNADAHRISQALTVPEYLEAWISIPNAAPGSCTLVSLADNGYRLDHDCANCPALSISGSFLYCHLRKMRLSWRRTANASYAESVVDFRLRGDFGSSIVELRHSELASDEEHAWHEALWQRSLEKLALLFGS
jgi:hypothetical protein